VNETPCKWWPIANTFGCKCCNCKYLQEFKRKEWKRIEKHRKNRKEQKRIEKNGEIWNVGEQPDTKGPPQQNK
jgi:hypothetical protein